MPKIVIVGISEDLNNDLCEFFTLQNWECISILYKTMNYSLEELLQVLRTQKSDVIMFQFPLLLGEIDSTFSNRYYPKDFIPIMRRDHILNKSVIVVITGIGDNNSILEAAISGADEYIVMPFEADNLLARITTRLERANELKSNLVQRQNPATYIRHHVFISYSRSDSFFMQKITEDLTKSGITYWTDETLEPGTPEWTKEIQDAIEHSGAFIVLMSPEAKSSIWVNREINYAEEHGIRIFPILIDGDQKASTPIQLIDTQITNVTYEYIPNIARLLKSIRKHIKIFDVDSKQY